MGRLAPENVERAREVIDRYPVARSALIPLLHLAQEQDGWVSPEAMEHIAELLDLTPAEVMGTASFYHMFKLEPVGRYVVNICTDISCHLTGGPELLEYAERVLGVPAGATTTDGTFTLEDVECIAACTEAPCLQVNYRYRYRVTPGDFDRLVDDLRTGRISHEIPDHGVLARIRPRLPADRRAGSVPPDDQTEPAWMP